MSTAFKIANQAPHMSELAAMVMKNEKIRSGKLLSLEQIAEIRNTTGSLRTISQRLEISLRYANGIRSGEFRTFLKGGKNGTGD